MHFRQRKTYLMTTKISKLPEIRKQNEISRKDDKVETMSTHEQLRSAHIETLEQLQVLKETNTCLRRDMGVLKLKSSSSYKDDHISDSQIDPLNDASDDTVLLNKIHDQEREIKNLKYRVCEADGEMRDLRDQSKLLRQQEFESKRKLEKERLEKEAEASKFFMASMAALTADNVSLQSSVENSGNKIQVPIYTTKNGTKMTFLSSSKKSFFVKCVHKSYWRLREWQTMRSISNYGIS